MISNTRSVITFIYYFTQPRKYHSEPVQKIKFVSKSLPGIFLVSLYVLLSFMNNQNVYIGINSYITETRTAHKKMYFQSTMV